MAPALLDREPNAFWARQALHYIPIHELGADFLLEWVREDPCSRAILLADAIGPPYGKTSPFHVRLLERYGHKGGRRLLRSIHERHLYGIGGFVDTRQVRDRARLAYDDHAPIRPWAAAAVKDLEESLKREEQCETEERFEY